MLRVVVCASFVFIMFCCLGLIPGFGIVFSLTLSYYISFHRQGVWKSFDEVTAAAIGDNASNNEGTQRN